MKYRQRQVETLGDTLYAFLDFRKTVWQNYLPFAGSVDKLNTMLETDLQAAKDAQGISTKGLTITKATRFGTANTQCFSIISQVKYLSNNTDNTDLFEKVNYVLSDLTRTPYPTIETIWKKVKKAANDNLTALQDYNITEQTLTDFQTSIDAFKSAKARPQSAIKAHKAGTLNVDTVCKGIITHLEKTLDNGVVRYMTEDLDFYQGYMLRRELTEPGYETLGIRINIVDKVSGLPLPKVKCTIQETGEVHNSSIFGNIIFRTMPSGTYTLIFERADLITVDKIVNYQKTLTTELMLQMELIPEEE